jgi:hypothetical protein
VERGCPAPGGAWGYYSLKVHQKFHIVMVTNSKYFSGKLDRIDMNYRRVSDGIYTRFSVMVNNLQSDGILTKEVGTVRF